MVDKRNILAGIALHVAALIESLSDRREENRVARREIVLTKREIRRAAREARQAKREREARAALPVTDVSVDYSGIPDSARADFDELNFMNAIYQDKLAKRAKRTANASQYSKRETRNKRRAARKARTTKCSIRVKISRANRDKYTELAALWYSRECARVNDQVDKGIKPNTLWAAYAPALLDNGKCRTLYSWAQFCTTEGIDVSGIRFKPTSAVADSAFTRRTRGANKLEALADFGFGPRDIRPDIPTYVNPPRGIRYTLKTLDEIDSYVTTRRADSRQLGSSVSQRAARPALQNPYTESGKLAPAQVYRASNHYSEPAAREREAMEQPTTMRCADGVVRMLGSLRGAWAVYFRHGADYRYFETTTVQRCADGIVRELGQSTENWLAYFGDTLE